MEYICKETGNGEKSFYSVDTIEKCCQQIERIEILDDWQLNIIMKSEDKE